jgi:thioredoxin-related protein
VESTNPIWKNYKVDAFPTYVLIDPNGYIVQAPALGPMPNGQYQTIDQTFFFIQQALNREKER